MLAASARAARWSDSAPRGLTPRARSRCCRVAVTRPTMYAFRLPAPGISAAARGGGGEDCLRAPRHGNELLDGGMAAVGVEDGALGVVARVAHLDPHEEPV